MARARSSDTNNSSGGIADSGIFGLIGTTVQCDSDDKSWYCKFAKLINVLVWILMLIAILYVAKSFFFNKK
jgi:hypothetical protein